MSFNLLMIHEINYKASLVTSKKKFKDFERWLRNILAEYNDAALERVANIQLFTLRERFSF